MNSSTLHKADFALPLTPLVPLVAEGILIEEEVKTEIITRNVEEVD
jgi:hypothetical protein